VLSPSYGVVSGGTRILVVVAVLCDVPGTDGVGRLCVIFCDVRSDPLLLGDSSFWYWFLCDDPIVVPAIAFARSL
jgi:hypothetical protein